MVSLKIAIAGTRGIPARYGGFETFADELSSRLVERGHEVAVYCREREGEGRGVQRIVLPAIRHKYFETVSHTLLSAFDALRRGFDVVLLCNAANAFVLPLLRAARIPVAINVDGIERHRRKWNVLGKAVYAIGESFSALFANRVVADANVIADYYRQRYGIDPVMIPYGAEFPAEDDSDVLERLGVEAGNYVLYVSRFEPENNPLEVVSAFSNLSSASLSRAKRGISGDPAPPETNVAAGSPEMLRFAQHKLEKTKLIMLGSASYAHNLEAKLRAHTSDQILFPGALYGRDYRTLQRNALIYIQATEVGGTHPAMIEAMASGGCVLALDTPENREVGADAVGYFRLRPSETLSGTLLEFLGSAATRERMRIAARARAAEKYGWTAVTDAYEQLFADLAR